MVEMTTTRLAQDTHVAGAVFFYIKILFRNKHMSLALNSIVKYIFKE
jgi:hypothetical protein